MLHLTVKNSDMKKIRENPSNGKYMTRWRMGGVGAISGRSVTGLYRALGHQQTRRKFAEALGVYVQNRRDRSGRFSAALHRGRFHGAFHQMVIWSSPGIDKKIFIFSKKISELS
jgi:hypothetical protein